MTFGIERKRSEEASCRLKQKIKTSVVPSERTACQQSRIKTDFVHWLEVDDLEGYSVDINSITQEQYDQILDELREYCDDAFREGLDWAVASVLGGGS